MTFKDLTYSVMVLALACIWYVQQQQIEDLRNEVEEMDKQIERLEISRNETDSALVHTMQVVNEIYYLHKNYDYENR